MTALGGLGHTLPYLIPHFWTATAVAFAVVVGRAGRHLLDPPPLHGHAVAGRGVPGHGRRRAGVRRRDIDRKLVIVRPTLCHPSIVRRGNRRCSSSPICPIRIWRRCPAASARALVQARARLHQLAAQAPRDPSRRGAGGARRRPEGAGGRPRRRDRRSGQPVAGRRIPRARAWLGALGGRTTSRWCPAITTPTCAPPPARRAHWADYMRGDAGESFPVRAPARAAGADRAVDLAADAAARRDRAAAATSSPGSARCWRTLKRERVPRRADPSSADRRRAAIFAG